MSRLDKLIADLCPDGVEYKLLSDIATVSRGGSLQKKDFIESGIPCIHYGQIYTKYDLFTNEAFTYISAEKAKKQKKAQPGDIVMAVTSENIEDVCKCVVWLGNEEVAVSGHTAIISHNQDAKYLAYYFHSSMFFAQKRKLAHGTKVIEVTPDHLGNIKIPVPPLEVQREIVRVLDNFTLLSAELSAELKARRKQYEYYTDVAFSKVEKSEYLSLTELVDIRTGKLDANARTEDGEYPFFTCDAKPYRIDKYAFDDEAILVSGNGSQIGHVNYYNGKFNAYQRTYVFTGFRNVMPKYLLLYLKRYIRAYCMSKSKKGSVPYITLPMLKDFKVPIPSMEGQSKIVDNLERFEIICNDISKGLPAEIEARKKQYEYYRDMLLTFKEKYA